MRAPLIHTSRWFTGPLSPSGTSVIGDFDCRFVPQEFILPLADHPQRSAWITIEDHIPEAGWTDDVWEYGKADRVQFPITDDEPTYQVWYTDRVQYQGQDYYRASLVPIVDVEEPPPEEPPEPGTDCATSPELELDTDYTYDISASELQVFHFPITASVQYHVTLTINSDSISGLTYKTGADCGSQTFRFLLSTTGCNSYTDGSGGIGVIEVQGAFFNGANYTINIGTGACP